ncbi:MAG: potassium channel protein [Myxococcales bacterium]|nr:potassium channel protein [Myxococcales bacterium]
MRSIVELEFFPRLRRAILLGTAVVAAGTIGYYFMFHREYSMLDCFYMTIVTISTVGFREVLPVEAHTAGKLLTIALIVGGTGTVLYIVSTITAFIVEGDLRHVLWRRRMERRIEEMSDHIIVCGVGSTGQHVAHELMTIGAPCVLIEQNPELVTRHRDLQTKATWIVDDATDEDVLLAAGVRRAKGLITALSEDKDNVYVTLTARQLNPNLRIVAKVINNKASQKLRQAGADKLVSPSEMGASRMVQEMIRPQIVTFLEKMLSHREQTLKLEEVTLRSGSGLVGKELREANLRRFGNILVLAVRWPDGETVYTPGPDLVLEDGMTLITLGRPDEVEKVRQIQR